MLILEEATSALTSRDVQTVYDLLACSFSRISTSPFIDSAKARSAVVEALEKLQIKIGDPADPVMTLTSCIASELVNGSPAQILLGMPVTLLAGTAFGFMNGLIVVYGPIQPIIATLATGAIAIGLALWVRPKPGVDGDLNWAITNSVWDFFDTYGFDADATWLSSIADIPVPIIILLTVAVFVWMPFRRWVTGRTIYAIGSAYMSGLPIDRAKIAAFTLGGFFAACGGFYLAIQTSSGNADIQQTGAYTLNSIAAVVLGGTHILGGRGRHAGTLVGVILINQRVTP
ncbi:MAG: ABC transporter permease [Alphaproteobacteria bacterium]